MERSRDIHSSNMRQPNVFPTATSQITPWRLSVQPDHDCKWTYPKPAAELEPPGKLTTRKRATLRESWNRAF